jgi:hypothetical protein
MSVADWIALGALAVAAVGPTVTSIRTGGRRDGKIDAAIGQLTQITRDHEKRLRGGGL